MKHRVAIFGTGTMASIYAGIVSQRNDCELAGFVGHSEETTRAIAVRYGTAGFPDAAYDAIFAAGDVDTVIIATPEWVRRDPLAVAVSHGCHILLEKPFADSLERADQLVEMLQGYDHHVALCHVLRYSPRFCALARSIRAGALGDLRQICARRNSNMTRVKRVLGRTDLVFWLSPHDIDIMRWVTGAEVSWVFASSRSAACTADDYIVATLGFDTGVLAILENSWCTPPLAGTANEACFEVRGTRGKIELRDADTNVTVYSDGLGVTAVDTYEDFELHGIRHGFFANMVDGFMRDVESGHWSRSGVKDGYETVRVASLIRRSLDSGGVVRGA